MKNVLASANTFLTSGGISRQKNAIYNISKLAVIYPHAAECTDAQPIMLVSKVSLIEEKKTSKNV